MAATSGKSLCKTINHLLALPHGEDALQDYLEVLCEAFRADSSAMLLVNPAAGTARILGGTRLRTLEGQWPDHFDSPFLAEQAAGFPDVPASGFEGPFREDPFLEREEALSLLVKTTGCGEKTLATVLLRRETGAYTPDEIEMFAAAAGVAGTLMLLHCRPGEPGFSGDDQAGLGFFSDFHQSMVKELSRARRSGASVTMGIMSIVSADPGFEKGVFAIARAFQNQLRNFDTLDRYGSRELAFILPDLRSAEGVRVLERVLKETLLSLGDQAQVPEIYLGLSCYPEDGATVERLIEMAEAAMNKAVEASTPGVFRWTE